MAIGLHLGASIRRVLVALIVVVPVGKAVFLEMKPRQRAREAMNYFDKVVELSGTGTAFRAKGMTPGLSPVILTGVDGKKQLFLVLVPKAR